MRDLKINQATHDIDLDNLGRPATINERNIPPESFSRLAGTPPTGYSRMIRSGDSTVILNPDYKSSLPGYVSASFNSLEPLSAEFNRIARYLGSISLLNVTLRATAANEATFLITYSLNSNLSAPQTIEITL